MVAELDEIKTVYPPLEMALDIRSCASILSSSVKNRYLVKQVLDQEPEDIFCRMEPPTWYMKDAPPLLKLCPLYSAGSRPQDERVALSLSVKSL